MDARPEAESSDPAVLSAGAEPRELRAGRSGGGAGSVPEPAAPPPAEVPPGPPRPPEAGSPRPSPGQLYSAQFGS